jgi:hypothetical protein
VDEWRKKRKEKELRNDKRDSNVSRKEGNNNNKEDRRKKQRRI